MQLGVLVARLPKIGCSHSDSVSPNTFGAQLLRTFKALSLLWKAVVQAFPLREWAALLLFYSLHTAGLQSILEREKQLAPLKVLRLIVKAKRAS